MAAKLGPALLLLVVTVVGVSSAIGWSCFGRVRGVLAAEPFLSGSAPMEHAVVPLQRALVHDHDGFLNRPNSGFVKTL